MAYDRDRYDRDRQERERRERERHERDDRGMLERAGDEVRSWFGDDEAQRRREHDERERERWNREDRWRGGESWSAERNYGERPYRDRPYGTEAYRGEGYRDYSDRYGRSYSSPVERSRFSTSDPERSPAFQAYTRGSQEFGPEGYGAPSAYVPSRTSAREFQSQERWRVPGPFVGRGPKGYRRSDERIREEISDRLTAHGMVDASDVEVQIQNGEVTLTGFVDSREAKRAAEDCAEDVAGVREVHNHLRIRAHAEDTTGVGRTSVLGLTEHQTQNVTTAASLDARERQADAANKSRSRNP